MSKKLIIVGIVFIIISVVLLATNLQAQTHVESKSFDIMLSTLLKHNVNEVGVDEIKNDSTSIFIDAREYTEFKVSHIKNAIWAGYDDFDIKRVNSVAKNKKIIVYCSVGYRSEKITNQLKEAGYLNVSNLYGGIFEWVNQNNPVVNMNGNITNKIHAYSKSWGIWLTEGEKVYE